MKVSCGKFSVYQSHLFLLTLFLSKFRVSFSHLPYWGVLVSCSVVSTPSSTKIISAPFNLASLLT